MIAPTVTTATHQVNPAPTDRATGRGRFGGDLPSGQADLASEFQSTLQQAQEQDNREPRAGRDHAVDQRPAADDASAEASADEMNDDAEVSADDAAVSEGSEDESLDEVVADAAATQVVAAVTTTQATDPTAAQTAALPAQAAPVAITSDADESQDAPLSSRTPAVDPSAQSAQRQATGNETNQSATRQFVPDAATPNTLPQPNATASPAIAPTEAAAPASPVPTGAAQQAAPPPALPHIDAPDPNVARLARALQSGINQNGGSVTLRMHPPELGVVRIDMQVRAGVVTATFHAEHPSIQNLLSHEMGQLRQALQSQGLVVDRLEVRVRDATDANATRQDQSNGESPSDGRSRGHTGQGNGQTARDAGTPERLSRRSFSRLLNTVG